jgi:hypothetical protein
MWGHGCTVASSRTVDERLHGAVEGVAVAHREAARMGMEGREERWSCTATSVTMLENASPSIPKPQRGNT